MVDRCIDAPCPVHFLRLTLTQSGTVRSTNFYLRGTEQDNYRAIRTLAKAKVTANTTSEQRRRAGVTTMLCG
jgi:hypothetical protein